MVTKITSLMYGLLSRDEQNTDYGFDSSNYMTSHSSYRLIHIREMDYACYVGLEGDEYIPRGLVIHSAAIRLEDIESVSLCYNDKKLITIPFSIIQLTSTITRNGGKLTVNFNDTFASFIGQTPMIRFPKYKASYGITMRRGAPIPTVDIILQYRFYCQTGRREIMNRPTFTQQVQYIHTYESTPSGRIDLGLRGMGGLIKGFFIEGEVDSVTDFRLQFDDAGNTYPIIEYTGAMLPIVGQRLSPTILYIPCNEEEKWTDNSQASYNGSLNGRALAKDGKPLSIHCASAAPYKIHVLMSDILIHLAGNNLMLKYSNDRSYKYYNKSISFREVMEKECAITYESVMESKHCRCATCKNYYMHDALEKYFISRDPLQPVCPICKTEWTNFAVYSCNDLLVQSEHPD